MKDGYVTLNVGSSSLKFSIFIDEHAHLALMCHGEINHLGSTPHFSAKDASGAILEEGLWGTTHTSSSYENIIKKLIQWIEGHLAPAQLVAVGHRVVHGGSFYEKPVRIDQHVLTQLESLQSLAPLHQPHNLFPIKILSKLHPDLPQIACFDTAFHVTNPRISRLYALPRALSDQGIMRYGFHGLSYEYIAQELPRHEPRAAAGKVVIAHLGNGASMCALLAGKSIATTMGFSALDGLPMGTRCGNIDPGVLLYLLKEKHMDADAIENLLYRESGLLGVSGLSNDMRELLQSDHSHAREAIDLFVYRIVRELGSLVAALGGLDALVFTGGIGEHGADIRAQVCAQSSWLPMHLDDSANRLGGPCISTSESSVSIWALATDEELMIARHVQGALKKQSEKTTAL